ncbi:MAG: InlB B-repeat-containing protein, partial [Clostridia bacterium]|nr:InlB B-repeat-containing protein [Clostridia bacterium]
VESTFDADNNKGAGGIVGYGGAAITVKGSAFIGTVKAPANAGAILGNCWCYIVNDKKQNVSQNIITDSFSNVGIKFCSKQSLNSKSDNNYSTSTDAESCVISITENKMKGAPAKENMSGLDWKKLWKTSDGFPLPNFDSVEDSTGNYWTGDVAETFTSGTGSETDPYIITNGEELALMVLDTENSGKFYKLGANIKLNDTEAKDWIYGAKQWIWTDNVFEGTFDGAGHTIEGLYYNGAKSKIGLFCYTKNATVKNVKFTNSYVKSAGFAVGTVIGDANSGTAKLYQCYVENGYVESTFNGDGNKGAGGLVGYGAAAITIEGSAYFGKVKAPANAGALLGNCWGKDKNGKSALVVTQSIAGAGLKLCTKQSISSLSDNNYSDSNAKESYVTYVANSKMNGKNAMKNMSGLDWGNLWNTASGKPVCRFGKTVSVAKDVWSGNVAESYDSGNGTEANPYIIKNGEQLAKMVLDTENEGKYYKLAKDIKLNDTSLTDWTYYAKQWIWTDNVFKGYFDADTHTISGLYFESTKSKVGLFCYTKNATLKRIVLDNAYVHSSGFATGALVGDANGGTLTITECYVKENASVKSTFNADNNMGAGGFVGYGGATIKIDGSAYLGTVSAPKNAGALLGNCWTSATVTNSFAVPEMKFCTKRTIAADSANNYGTGAEKENGVTSVKVSQMKGTAAKTNMPSLNWVRSWKTSKGYPVLNVGEYEGVKGGIWSGRLAKNFAGGSGTKDDPYLIATGEQLAKLVANVLEAKGKYYKLIADIYLNDISKPDWEKTANQWFWVSTARNGNFNGHFNGDGHVIYGMYLNMNPVNSVIYTGLFPTISDGTVIEKTGLSDCHMIVENNDVDKQSYVGGFAGVVFYNQADEETDLNNLPVISQCFGDTKVILEGRYAGGIVGGGARTANIDNSYFVGQVIGERVGAIIGNTWTTFEGTKVTNCYSATNAVDIFSGGRAGVQNSSTPIGFKDNYSNASGLGGFVTQLSLLMMRGESAKKNMPALDFDKIWYALENGTPVLRIFGTTDKFSNTSDPEPIEISFVSNGGSDCKSIFGNPEEKLTLPTPERTGYKFEGWYVYKELDIPYSIDYFPYFDQILYAKWTPLGIIQDFEDYENSPYDYGDDYEYYRPGTVGYDAEYVRSGMAAMHRI